MKTLIGAVAAGMSLLAAGGTRTMTLAEFRDRMAGAWIGQSVGVTYGFPTEFKSNGTLVPDEMMPVWTPQTINGTFDQDDLYVEMTFMRTLETRGLDVTCRQAGIDFANSAYPLWCANDRARNNVRNGIAAPASSHPQHHPSTDDIDYQIEADFSGILSPGLPQAAVDLGETFGRIMNYGDGLYGGQFMGAMYAHAYFETNRVTIVREALKAIPAESVYAGMVRDVLAWYGAAPEDWKGTWSKAVERYGRENGPFQGKVSQFAIDAKINGAFVLIGFLYGQGDMERTMRIATACGYDSDCNPSSACGVLGTMLGASKIDPKYYMAVDMKRKWVFTEYDADGLLKVSEALARKIVVRYGGRIERNAAGEECFVIPKTAVRPSAFADSKAPGPLPADVRLTDAEQAEIRYRPTSKWAEESQLKESAPADARSL